VDASRTVEQAITWALEHVGSGDYRLRCLAFVEDAYEIPNGIEIFGGSCASESAEIYRAADAEGLPPAGAFVFFDTHGVVDGVERNWGHVGLALGDARMVHAWPDVRVDAIADFPMLPSGSWSTPVYAGFATPARILQGAEDRS
jgi:hypothetical protein